MRARRRRVSSLRAPLSRSSSCEHARRSRPDRSPRPRGRGSWRRSGSSTDRRCRSARRPRHASRPAAPRWPRTGRGSRPRDRWAGCLARARSSRCAGRSRRARMPPWTLGCSVFTRPPSISGLPVSAATSVDAEPGAAQRLGRAAGGHELDTEGSEPPAELQQAGLVVNGEQGARHAVRRRARGHGGLQEHAGVIEPERPGCTGRACSRQSPS